jgi:isoleucyl-tRNA synthetase
VAAFGDRVAESVHLCDYPTGDASLIDETLSQRMALGREIVSLGRSARMGAKLKVRQPLSLVEVVLSDATHQEWLEEHGALICKELNVKKIEFTLEADEYISYKVLPDLKRLGPKLGKQIPDLKRLLSKTDGGQILAEIETHGCVTFELPQGPVTLDSDDIQVRMQAKEGWAAAQGDFSVVVLATELTDELIAEGYARELVRVVQDRRKAMDCEFTDRIAVGLVTEAKELTDAVQTHRDYVMSETLALELTFDKIPDSQPLEIELADMPLVLYVKVISE